MRELETPHIDEPRLALPTFNESVAPCYRRLPPRLQEHGIPLFMDTDGDVTLLAPWLEELGVRGVLPLERLADWTGMMETELFAQTYKSYGLATVRYPVLEVTATVEPFENGRGFSLRVLRAGKPRQNPGSTITPRPHGGEPHPAAQPIHQSVPN